MDNNLLKQILYVIGIIATVYVLVTVILPAVIALTGWILGIAITAIVFAALIAAILYSISKLAEMLRK